MSCKRPWADQVVESHSESKRVCIGSNDDCDKEETGLVLLARPHAKLKWANPPSRVMALSNVVERIEELSLTPEENLEEAVRTGQVQLLSELTTEFTGDVSGAVLAAARSGRTDMLEILLASQSKYFDDEETGCKYEEEEECGQFVAEAAVVASREGHLEAMRLLHDRVYYYDDRYETLWRVLEEAAASGHAHVVKYAVDSLRDVGDDEFMDCTADRSWQNCRALSLAISGGHVDVVEVLLDGDAPSGVWDVKDAFEQALKEGQEDVAWGIYEAFRDRLSGCEDADLIVQMVRGGSIRAVKNLVKTDFGIDRIGDAFITAVKAGRPKIVEFLHDTGRVPPRFIDGAFEEAARYGSVEAVKFLYSNRRISPQSISKAFELAGNLAVVKFLYHVDHISLDALVAAFERVTQPTTARRSEDDPPDMCTEDRIEIIKLLCGTGCISSELIGEAFVRAARSGYTNVVVALRDDECVDSMVTSKAFICACYYGHTAIAKVLSSNEGIFRDTMARSLEVGASRGHAGIVELLCSTQRLSPAFVVEIVEKEASGGSTHLIKGLHTQEHLYIDAIAEGLVNAATKGWVHWVGVISKGKDLSSEVICEVFMKASGRGCLDIVQKLFRESYITCAIKHEAFINASRHGQAEIVKFFDISASWSLETLNQALEATRDIDILHYLCKKIGETLARNVNKVKVPKRRRARRRP